MAVAFDSFHVSALSTGNITISCTPETPEGNPKGVAVAIMQAVSSDQVTSVTYGGVTCNEITNSPLLKTTGEIAAVHWFYLGASVPTGTQDCVITRTSANAMIAGVVLLTASGNTELVDSATVQNDSLDDPTIALALSSRTSFCAVAFNSGRSDNSFITPLTNWTSRHEEDFGSQVAGIYTYDTIASADVTAGWLTDAADDANGLALAVSEVAAGNVTVTPTTATLNITTYAPVVTTGGAAGTMQCADRASGMAELAVQFSVLRGNDLGDSIPIHGVGENVDTVRYVWDFGDGDDFTADGDNLRIGFGPNVSHVYKTAGTYTAKLTSLEANGVSTEFTQTITVSAWSSTTYYFNSETGNDTTGDGTLGTPWATATKMHSHLAALAAGTTAEYLFTAVDSNGAQMVFTHDLTTTIGTRTAAVRIGTYDPGSTSIKPKIQTANAAGWLAMSSDADDVRIVGLHIVGIGTPSNIGLRPGKHTTIHKVHWDGFDSAISTSSAHGLKQYFCMSECTTANLVRYGVFFNFGQYCALIANTINGVTLTGEHLYRLYWDQSWVAYNRLIGGSGNNKNQIKWVGIAPIGSANRPAEVPGDIANSTYCTIWRNRGSAHPAGMDWAFAFSPIDNTNDELSTQLMVWENRISAGGDLRSAYYINWGANSYVNNVADLSGSSGVTRIGFQVVRRGVEAVPDDNHLYHNTVYCSGGAGTIRPFSVDVGASTTPDGNDLRNNLTNIISGSGTVSGTDGIVDAGTNTTKTPNLYTTSTTCLLAPGGVSGDYTPRDGGAAVDGVDRISVAVLAAGWDLSLATRPAAAGQTDYGAYEFTGTSVEPIEPSPLIPSSGVNTDKVRWDSGMICFRNLARQGGVTGGTPGAYGWQPINATTFDTVATSVLDFIDSTGYPDVELPLAGETIEMHIQSPFLGTHVVQWDGTATIGVAGNGATATTLTATGDTFQCVATYTQIKVRILTSASPGGLSNFRIIPLPYMTDFTNSIFHTPLIDRLSDFSRQVNALSPAVLRSMELTRTNGDKPVTGWANRALTTWVSHATGFGMAWEYVCDIANEMTADLWVCVPHQADDAYVTSLAQLLLSDLDTDSRLFVEFSNEASWNGGFDQTTYCRTQGASFTGSTAQKGRKFYAKRSAEIFDIFITEWGESAGRLVKVLGSQASSTTVTTELLNYFDSTTIDGISVNPNGTKVNALAIAPYFGLHTTTGERFADDVYNAGTWQGMSYANAVAAIRANYYPLAIQNVTNQAATLATFATVSNKTYTGCQLVCYEAGQNLTGNVTATQNDAGLTAWLTGLQQTPEFYDLYLQYLTDVNSRGAVLICHFHFADNYTGADMYGAMETLDQSPEIAQKYKAIRDFNNGARWAQSSRRGFAASGAVLAYAGARLRRLPKSGGRMR